MKQLITSYLETNCKRKPSFTYGSFSSSCSSGSSRSLKRSRRICDFTSLAVSIPTTPCCSSSSNDAELSLSSPGDRIVSPISLEMLETWTSESPYPKTAKRGPSLRKTPASNRGSSKYPKNVIKRDNSSSSPLVVLPIVLQNSGSSLESPWSALKYACNSILAECDQNCGTEQLSFTEESSQGTFQPADISDYDADNTSISLRI